MTTLNTINAAWAAKFATLCQTINPDADITNNQDKLNTVTDAMDEVAETNNPNLPPRPPHN